ncbi:MAG: TIM44-like domain-containing protein, partial [Mariprofundales bacterium]|nr:TIM44-like domain-containing protein [Mariprofundales bacterium]
MIRYSLLLLSAIIIMAAWPADSADARRFGGGASFGSHHRSLSPGHTQRASRPAASRQMGNSRPPRSGFMGAIAGLAMGGLLGALLFGGAFNGINMFDIILIGTIALGLLWWFRRQAQQISPQHQQSPLSPSSATESESTHNYFDPNHDAHANLPPRSSSGTNSESSSRPQIDVAPFLDASRAIFVRMQSAWDRQDIDDIRRFCLPEVVAYIEGQIEENREHTTEVVTLEANLLNSWIEAGREWAAVEFTAMIKEQTSTADGSLLDDSSA